MDTTLKKDIREALEKILAYPGFRRSPLLSRFLRFVVETTLDDHGNQIKEYTVGIEVFDKPQHFNPQVDAAVRINAIRLRKLLSEYYQEGIDDSPVHIELPKGSYVPVFSLKSDNPAYVPQAHGDNREFAEMVGILPFTALVNPATSDFSVSGFCEFLSKKLSLFEDIRVVSFHSMTRFMDEDGNMEQIAGKLGLSHYLTGSIELDNNNFLVSYQLIEAKTQSLIWSQQIESHLNGDGLMVVADNISSQIVSSLAGYSGLIHYRTLLDKSIEPPISNKTANAIFWFYHYEANHSSQLFYQAIQRLETVVTEDPNCSLCWAVLAHLYADALIYNYHTEKNALETATAYVNKAFALDPECQHALLVQAWIHILTGKGDEAIPFLEKTDAANPLASSFKAMCCLGMALTGKYERSFEFLKQAKQLNPLPFWWMNLPEIFISLKNHEYEKVVFFARKSGTPPVIFEHIFEMIGLFYLGDINNIRNLLKIYVKKYPAGIDYLTVALPAIISDKNLSEMIRSSLVKIGQMAKQSAAANGH